MGCAGHTSEYNVSRNDTVVPTQLVGSVKDSRLGRSIGSLTVASARPKAALDVPGGFAWGVYA